MRYLVYSADDITGIELGGKAGALHALAAHELPVPPWFVIRPEAFWASLDPSLRTVLETAGRDVTGELASLAPTAEVEAELRAALRQLAPNGERLAVRSSAAGEDSSGESFAGQLESWLFVSPGDVARRVADVWRSGFSERVLTYRRERRLGGAPPAPAVLIQRMVNPQAAGVAFSADPVSGRRGIAVVGAVYGVGSGLVSGDCDADTYYVDRAGSVIERRLVRKLHAHRPDPASPDGVSRRLVEEGLADASVLNDEQVRAVARLARDCARHFGRPQDIEWAIAEGRLVLLQSRPITSLADLPDPEGVLNLWDNSNIAESYRGVTTPMTFSFARRAYESVYREFCRLLQVPEHAIAAHDTVFANMLGLIHGQVYYNLLNWYRVLMLLPGYQMNRHFMEQMMGVREALPDELLATQAPVTWLDRGRDGLRLLRTVGGLIASHWRLPRQIRRFHARLDVALGDPQPALADQRPDELAGYYRELERQLLTRWDAPLVNDFFAMIHYGVLRKLCQKWCGDADGTLQNDLLCAEGGMISAEPARRIRALAEIAARDPALVRVLTGGAVREIEPALNTNPALAAGVRGYLDRFGDRCLEELKLESATLEDDPLPFYRSIGHFAERLQRQPVPDGEGQERERRRAAETRVTEALSGHSVRRVFFRWVLKHCRARVRDRENLRFERTRLFGRVRRVLVELGRRLHALDRLAHPRDIFYLELDEVLAFVDGTASTTNLMALVALREAEFSGYRDADPLPGRFETRGPVGHGQAFRSTVAETIPTGDSLSGTGCCPGVVRGPVRVIIDPRGAQLKSGEILVAERTDPGWIMLFPAAAGLLVEHGSLLSHSAIVSREMGLPSVVGLAGITRWLKDGDWIEMNGSTGRVTRIAPPGETT